MDTQTSGGLLICCDRRKAKDMLQDLTAAGYLSSIVVGEVEPFSGKHLIVGNLFL
ncbi:MAG: hypothetical protein WC699_00670 [Bacteroidales bacterium]